MEEDNSCLRCKYYPSTGNTQECMRYEQGGRVCEENEESCYLMNCPEHCIYPYDATYFNESQRDDYNRIVNQLNDNPNDTGTQNEFLAKMNVDNLDPEVYTPGTGYKTVTDENIGTIPTFKCANIIKGREIPNLPDMSDNNIRNKLIGAFTMKNDLNRKIDHIEQTQWDKIKIIPELMDYQLEVTDDGNINKKYISKEVISNNRGDMVTNIRNGDISNVIETSNNGVDLNWWKSPLSDSELMEFVNHEVGIDNYIPDSHNIDDIKTQIHTNRGNIIKNKLEGSALLTHLNSLDITLNETNICEQEVIDWLNKEMHITSAPGRNAAGVSPIFSFSDIFNISGDTNLGPGFESCLNQKFDTEDDDEKMIENITSYKGDMTLLTKTDIRYIKKKIIKFLQLKPEDIDECLDKIEDLTLNLCEGQLSKNSMEVLGKVLLMDTPNIDTSTELGKQKLENLKVVQKELLPFVPQILRQIINISEEYEKNYCPDKKISVRTDILKEMYNDIFVKGSVINMNFPDFGMVDFFSSFTNNMVGKIILLIFIAYILSLIAKMFKFTYNLSKE